MTARRALHSGFSLLELLIAVMAFAIVLAAINGVFYSGLKLRNRSAASLDRSLPITQAVAVLKRDLANLGVPSTNSTHLIGELQSTPTGSSGAASQPRFGSIGGATGAGGGLAQQVSPDFYTLSGLIDNASPWPNVQKVAYLLVDSTKQTAMGKDLVRAVTRNLLPASGIQEDPAEQVLLPDVAEVLFSYHNGTDWQDTWDSTTASPKLPRAIKVQIQLAAEDRLSRQAPIEIVVPIFADAGTNSASGGGQ
ncbi:MAG: type II secretion system protein GspJ [Limisphaerales bacterium]